MSTGTLKQGFRFGNHRGIPQCRVLLRQWDVPAVLLTPSVAAGFRVQHQCKEAQRLWLLGQELRHDPGKKHRLLLKIAADNISSSGIGPSLCKGSIDGIENCLKAVRQLLALRHAEWNACLSNLILGAHEAL